MPFELNNSVQSRIFFMEQKSNLYEYAHDTSLNSGWIRASGIGIALASSLLTIAEHVANIFEKLIKGLVNIIGSPFCEECDLKRGLKQVIIQTPMALLECITLPIYVGIGVIVTTIVIAVDPASYSQSRMNHHKAAAEKFHNWSRDGYQAENLLQKNMIMLTC